MLVRFEFRDMTDEEYKREQEIFDTHGLAFGNPPEKQERLGFVAQDNGKFVWTWTASYEAETFYQKLGYDVFVRFENYYSSGHSRVGMIKQIG